MIGSGLALTVSLDSRPRNHVLTAISAEDLCCLRRHLKRVSLARGKVLCEADEPLRYVYFVETGAVSLVTLFEDGSTAELATVGREGLVGIGTLLGGEHVLGRYVVPLPGSALAIEVPRFQGALREHPGLRAACEIYAQAFLTNLLQNVACASCHRLEQRCARWLLMCDDQADDGSFELTHERLAEMLGVRRPAVTLVAGTLQSRNLIRYHRGAIEVVDRQGLEAVACQCYRVVRRGYERVADRPGRLMRANEGQRHNSPLIAFRKFR